MTGYKQVFFIAPAVTLFVTLSRRSSAILGLYDNHFYAPYSLTSWFRYNDALPTWPDQREIYLPEDNIWEACTCNNPSPPVGDSDWTYYEGDLYYVDDPLVTIGYPVFQSVFNPGIVWFDDFTINEYDSDGNFVRVVYEGEIDSNQDWVSITNQWEAVFPLDDSEGHSDQTSLILQDVEGYASWSLRTARFNTIEGNAYSIDCWMRTAEMPEDGYAQARLDFVYSPSGQDLVAWNRDYLEAEMDRWIQPAVDNNLPMNIGEFGVDRDLLDNNGGLIWVEDMIALMIERDLSFTMHVWDIFHDRDDIFDLFAEYLLTNSARQTPVSVLSNDPVITVYPQPFNGRSTVSIELKDQASLELHLYNILGRIVLEKNVGMLSIGSHKITVNTGDLASGTYFMRLISNGEILARQKLVLNK